MPDEVKATKTDVRAAKEEFSRHCSLHGCRPLAADPSARCEERIALWLNINKVAAMWNVPA